MKEINFPSHSKIVNSPFKMQYNVFRKIFLGEPIQVHISVSLRNILDIDEVRQVCFVYYNQINIDNYIE